MQKKMLSKLKNNNLLIIISIIFIILIKTYYLIINPIDYGSFAYHAHSFVFYNFKSFLISPQSFHDWNHPGTPIYYIYYILNLFYKFSDINQFNTFLLISHLISITLYFISFYLFFNHFKKRLATNELIIFIFFSFSFLFSIENLEIVDPTNYLYPFALILCVECDKIFFNEEEIKKITIIKISILSALAGSIKLTFFPFIVTIYLALLFKFFLAKKIKYYILAIISFAIFIAIFNFPILGRLPKIIFNVLFLREDSNISNIFNLHHQFLELMRFIIEINLPFFIFIIAIFFLILLNLFNKQFEKNSLDAKIYTLFLSLFFFYTLTLVSYEMRQFKNSTAIADLFRNNYLYSVCLIPIFRIFKFSQIQSRILLFLSFLAFAQNLIFYENYRNERILDIKDKNIIFNNELKKRKILFENNNVAIFSSYGYPFANEMYHFTANSLFAGEKFNNELLNNFNNFNYFRLIDIINTVDKQDQHLSFSHLRRLNDQIDSFLLKKTSGILYLILSPKSFDKKNISLNNPLRSKNYFIKKSKNKIRYIIYSDNDDHYFINNSKKILVKNYIKKNTNQKIKELPSIKVKNNNWVIYEIY
jgi:hypothetical protein